jgi:hypothetical protein
MTQNNVTKTPSVPVKTVPKRPNETGSISVQGFVKIFDPENQKVFVEKPA